MKRNGDVPLPYSQTSALPQRQPTQRGPNGTIKRSKTLTRPERHVAPVPLINPAQANTTPTEDASKYDWWTITSWIVTFWALPPFLRAAGIKEQQSQQAWREKITLVFIALCMGGFVGFATMGLQSTLCPGGPVNRDLQLLGSQPGTISVHGWAFNFTGEESTSAVNLMAVAEKQPGQDITPLFARSATDYPACTSSSPYASTKLCDSPGAPTDTITNSTECLLPTLNTNTLGSLGLNNITLMEGYSWEQVALLENYMVIDGLVLNMNPYLTANPNPMPDDLVDTAIRQAISNQASSGKDVTRVFHNRKDLQDAIDCLTTRYLAGRIDKMTPGCFVASLFLYLSLIVILAVVLIRFFMAIVFSWFLSSRLVETPKDLAARTAIAPTVMPEGANVSIHNQNGTAPWASGQQGQKGDGPSQVMSLARIGSDLFTVCLVTCYSEGEAGIRSTLDSIATTTFPDERQLIWVVCDGMITGAGEKASTPDICVGMLEADPRFGNPQPMGYIAIGAGNKRENRAMVYAGHYVKNGHRVPTVMVVKCGTPNEATDKKPGNRGKRDSQLILMNFFSRVTYNDRMSPLDFDLFRKVHTLMGVTPDFFEVCLMVDADTVVLPDAMTYMVHCMAKDNMVMGVCGETRIANKRQSWVTAIQVFEYYISHHHIKAFESVFGGVTCLPGCFSMYRIKARKDDDNDWVPILVKPEIVREYSQSDVVTLHQKNLLLLGEDRFLSTILLRTFPHRRNLFLPQARCRTIAPDEFKVLLSQRRRWINSTVHNLMELVLVRDLCGTFCFSMQFVVFMDLVGTVVLPIAICLTGALVVNSILQPPRSFSEAIPLMLLACILGLPAILIMLTTRQAVYVAWMFVYLAALPVWNFVLPVYSFWHFDDFSWGETRKVEGEVVDKSGHGPDDPSAVFDGTGIPLRRWDDWERSRLRKIRREEKRRRQMERMHGQTMYGDDALLAPERGFARPYTDSDQGSIVSTEEDVWGGDVGGYNEENPQFPPPPVGLPPDAPRDAYGRALGMDQMAAMLDTGFDERPKPAALRPDRKMSPSPLQRIGARSPVASYSSNGSSHSPVSPHGTPIGYAGMLNSHAGYMPAGTSSPVSQTTSIETPPRNGHARQRSGGTGTGAPAGNGYGPLGPLSDADGGHKHR